MRLIKKLIECSRIKGGWLGGFVKGGQLVYLSNGSVSWRIVQEVEVKRKKSFLGTVCKLVHRASENACCGDLFN